MNDITTVDTTEATLVPVITDVKHYAITIDADGNEVRTECEAPVLGHVQAGEGEVATEYATV